MNTLLLYYLLPDSVVLNVFVIVCSINDVIANITNIVQKTPLAVQSWQTVT